MKSIQSHRRTTTPYYFAWFAISLFYFYQYILRVSPGVMVLELRQIFKLTAEEFSSLGAIYLYAYSFFQIPLGFIIDRIGVRRLTVFSILTCLIGTFLFACAENIWMLQAGRFLIGIGSAPAFICALKLISDYLPEKDRGLLMGGTLAIGTIGALLSGHFLVTLLESSGWQKSLFFCIGLGAIILVVILFLVPVSSSKTPSVHTPLVHLQEGLRTIFRQKEILLYSVIAIGLYTPLCVLADLWGTAFLMEKFFLDRAQAAQTSLYMYGGLTIGSILVPWYSAKWESFRETIQICAIGLFVTIFALLFFKNIAVWQLTVLLTLTGIFCGAEMVCFTGAAHYTVPTYSGLALGFVNTLNMLGGALVQHLIGWYLDFQWKGRYGADGARLYGPEELTAAFSLLLILIVGCCFLTIMLPKKAKAAQPLISSSKV